MIVLRRFLSRLSMTRPYLTIVVALDDCLGIGRDNTVPWHIKNDLKFFRYVTTERTDSSKQNAIILGRKTFETFPKPLPNRLNIVVSSNPALANTNHSNVARVDSFDNALKCANDDPTVENTFIIGGVSIYEAAMKSDLVKRVMVTRVKGDFKCTAVWSSFNLANFTRVERIPENYQQFFEQSDEIQDENQTPPCHLEIYDRKM